MSPFNIVFTTPSFVFAFSLHLYYITAFRPSSCIMSMSPPGTLHQIKRKPPPPLDTSGKYPSPDPSDPFASLCALRNRTTSGLESDIVSRARSAPHLYSTATSQVPANIVSISSIPLPSPYPKLGHYYFHSQTTLMVFFTRPFPPSQMNRVHMRFSRIFSVENCLLHTDRLKFAFLGELTT